MWCVCVFFFLGGGDISKFLCAVLEGGVFWISFFSGGLLLQLFLLRSDCNFVIKINQTPASRPEKWKTYGCACHAYLHQGLISQDSSANDHLHFPDLETSLTWMAL